MKISTRRRRTTAIASASAALLAGLLTMLGTGAPPAAAAGTVSCSGAIVGKAGGYLRLRHVRNSTVTDSYRSPATVSWSPRSWTEWGAMGGPDSFTTSFIVPSGDGKARTVDLSGEDGNTVLTGVTVKQFYKTDGTAVTGWNPHKVVNGPTSALYTVAESGAIRQATIVYQNGVRFGSVSALPVTFGSSKTVAGVWTRNSSGVMYNILYSINTSTNKLEQIIVRPDRPAEAKKYVVRSIGTGWRYMSVHNCYDADGMVAAKDIVLINPTTGNAVRIRQSSGLGHSTTFSAAARVGTDGTWKWSGISS